MENSNPAVVRRYSSGLASPKMGQRLINSEDTARGELRSAMLGECLQGSLRGAQWGKISAWATTLTQHSPQGYKGGGGGGGGVVEGGRSYRLIKSSRLGWWESWRGILMCMGVAEEGRDSAGGEATSSLC